MSTIQVNTNFDGPANWIDAYHVPGTPRPPLPEGQQRIRRFDRTYGRVSDNGFEIYPDDHVRTVPEYFADGEHRFEVGQRVAVDANDRTGTVVTCESLIVFHYHQDGVVPVRFDTDSFNHHHAIRASQLSRVPAAAFQRGDEVEVMNSHDSWIRARIVSQSITGTYQVSVLRDGAWSTTCYTASPTAEFVSVYDTWPMRSLPESAAAEVAIRVGDIVQVQHVRNEWTLGLVRAYHSDGSYTVAARNLDGTWGDPANYAAFGASFTDPTHTWPMRRVEPFTIDGVELTPGQLVEVQYGNTTWRPARVLSLRNGGGYVAVSVQRPDGTWTNVNYARPVARSPLWALRVPAPATPAASVAAATEEASPFQPGARVAINNGGNSEFGYGSLATVVQAPTAESNWVLLRFDDAVYPHEFNGDSAWDEHACHKRRSTSLRLVEASSSAEALPPVTPAPLDLATLSDDELLAANQQAADELRDFKRRSMQVALARASRNGGSDYYRHMFDVARELGVTDLIANDERRTVSLRADLRLQLNESITAQRQALEDYKREFVRLITEKAARHSYCGEVDRGLEELGLARTPRRERARVVVEFDVEVDGRSPTEGADYDTLTSALQGVSLEAVGRNLPQGATFTPIRRAGVDRVTTI